MTRTRPVVPQWIREAGQVARGGRVPGPVEARGVGRAARAAFREPGRERDLAVQSLKAAGAALLAWVVADEWLGDPMALMAPWVAVVLVQTTVYSSLRQAVQQFAAICAGTLLASASQVATGTTLGGLALSVPVLMLLANWPRFGDQGIYAVTTAIFTLASGTVSTSAVSHRVGQAALGAVIGVAVNALVLPPVHLRDVRENLAALAREAGDALHTVADDLRKSEWDAHTTVGWLSASARLEYRLDALRSARHWSRESLRTAYGPLRAVYRVPLSVPPEEEDERWSRVTGHITALNRTLAVAADDGRTPAPPRGPVLGSYAHLLDLIGDACHAEGSRLLEGHTNGPPDGRTEEVLRRLHRQLQDGLREHAWQGAAHAAVLGTLLLQAENLWAEIVPVSREE
ncbi:aromatic acid exporter family protein [Streptomyces sp. TRM68367]|uniref:FUSC family protein n=1 Tax=Streptomyces sp. TRM68367 TaxID=2758415 RepID=UPI00165A6560|nr:aromatic acid exporter family protein [Streptomyces sp. TRM68367]MBC9727641.1 FUSC family protein [Streptomyces sp. TRM68367]